MSKRIRIPCPNCRVELRARPEYLGQSGRCKHCGHPFRLWSYVRVPCPNCRSLLDVRHAYLGQWVSCKHCNHVFLVHSPDDPAQSPPSFTLAPGGQIAADESVTFEVSPMPSRARGRQSEAELGGSATLYAETLQQLESARDEIAWLLGQVQELQDQCDEMRAHQRAAEAARADLLAARSELDALRAQAASLRDRAAEADRLETELGACRVELFSRDASER